ncbi:MAG: hypothetical protein K2P38_09740 [Lachnospiraceae bacterium]|nr:hypothetical protein [Lachnospiraceae bacterium]
MIDEVLGKLDVGYIEFRNVAVELEGVKEAVKWAIVYNKRKIIIYYEGDIVLNLFLTDRKK